MIFMDAHVQKHIGTEPIELSLVVESTFSVEIPKSLVWVRSHPEGQSVMYQVRTIAICIGALQCT